jgi:hypothetical protein
VQVRALTHMGSIRGRRGVYLTLGIGASRNGETTTATIADEKALVFSQWGKPKRGNVAREKERSVGRRSECRNFAAKYRIACPVVECARKHRTWSEK